MTSRYRVSLGGIQMDTLDKNLLILDVAYSELTYEQSHDRAANVDGYDIGETYLEKQTVTVSFELHIYDTAKRNAACQAVNAWASAGGTLTINDRAGQALYNVKCEKQAVIESVRDWTKPLTIVFATTYVPQWQSVKLTELPLEGSSPTGKLKLDGNTGDALVSVDLTAKAKITTCEVTVGGTKLSLLGLNLTSGKKLTINYVRNRYLQIREDNKSAMGKLQATSNDRLLAPCGVNSDVKIVCNGKMSATVTARGKWL